MARILLVRHAPTPETGTRLTGRLPGHTLSQQGEAAARVVSEALSATKIKSVYASPLERTMETANIVAAPHKLTPIVEEGMIEMDFGDWTGRTLKSLRRTALWNTVQRVPSRMRFPGGETFAEAQNRAVEAVERVAAEVGNATAVIVSHSDVIKLAVSYFLGQPLDQFQRLMISTASITDVRLGTGATPFVVSINGTGARS